VSSLFFALQSYAVTYITLQKGTIVDLAIVSALTRFGQIFSLLNAAQTSLLQPYVSRCRGWAKVRTVVLASLGAAIATVLLIIVCASVFSRQLGFILGSQYSQYTDMIPLALTGPSIYFIGTSIYSMLIARGEARGQWLTMPFGLGGIVAGLYLIPFSQPADFLLFEIGRCSAFLLCQSLLLGHWLLEKKKSEDARDGSSGAEYAADSFEL